MGKEIGFFSRHDMGGYPDEQMKKALEEALKNMNKPQEEPASANYMQVVPDSHRYTVYGLKTELQFLLGRLMINEQLAEAEIVKHMIIGLENSTKAGEEITKLI